MELSVPILLALPVGLSLAGSFALLIEELF